LWPPVGAGPIVPRNSIMGHRALIAYERSNGKYNLHYSHRGALHLRLKRKLTPETPFGGETVSDDVCDHFEVLLDREQEDTPGIDLPTDDRAGMSVELEPLACDLSFDGILTEHLDFLHYEALYVVTSDFDVSAYLTLWLGLEYDCESITESQTVSNGALRTVSWHDGEPINDGYIQGEFQALKSVVGDLVDRDVFTSEEAIEYMKEKLAQWTSEREELKIQTPE